MVSAPTAQWYLPRTSTPPPLPVPLHKQQAQAAGGAPAQPKPKRSCLAGDVEVTAAGKMPPMLATAAQIRGALAMSE